VLANATMGVALLAESEPIRANFTPEHVNMPTGRRRNGDKWTLLPKIRGRFPTPAGRRELSVPVASRPISFPKTRRERPSFAVAGELLPVFRCINTLQRDLHLPIARNE